MRSKEELEAKIEQLEKELADLAARLPKHSAPPAMVMRQMEIEDELEELKNELIVER